MSAIYNLEPPTKGKVCFRIIRQLQRTGYRVVFSPPPRATDLQVVIKTTLGDIDIELWAKEAPKVCLVVC